MMDANDDITDTHLQDIIANTSLHDVVAHHAPHLVSQSTYINGKKIIDYNLVFYSIQVKEQDIPHTPHFIYLIIGKMPNWHLSERITTGHAQIH